MKKFSGKDATKKKKKNKKIQQKQNSTQSAQDNTRLSPKIYPHGRKNCRKTPVEDGMGGVGASPGGGGAVVGKSPPPRHKHGQGLLPEFSIAGAVISAIPPVLSLSRSVEL